MSDFVSELKEQLKCDVRHDSISRQLYAVDASIFEIEPIAVVIPRTKDDIIQAMEIASKHKVSVIPRGAATGITGGCLGKGLVIDTSVYLNSIVQIDYEKELATVEVGVIQDELNRALSERGYRLGPDTSTGNRATIGGMVANNAGGAHALKFGQMVDHVVACNMILYGGKELRFEALDKKSLEAKCQEQTQEGEIYRTVFRIQKEYGKEVEERFPKVPRRVSGYNLNELIKPDFCNLAKLITGSEGTLGFITDVTVTISKKPKEKAIVLVATKDMLEALKHAESYVSFKPYALELIDKKIIEAGSLSPSMQGRLSFLQGAPNALFVVEFEADTKDELQKKCQEFQAAIQGEAHIHYLLHITDPQEQENIWQLRKSGLGLLLSKRSYSRAIAFIEDIAIGPHNLSKFVSEFVTYLRSQGKEAGIYGHIGDGCLHIRPYINQCLKSEHALMKKIATDVANMVARYNGALSAEHGDGLIRTFTNPKMFGEKIYQAFVELKKAFDPDFLMNPNKIVSSQPISADEAFTQLRLAPDTKIIPQKTFFDFKREGGFELAADLCNGNGQCRKGAKNQAPHVMCPSFQVTGEEKDSTRARANVFRALIHGKIKQEELFTEEVKDVLDLCIQCKGCKTECPSQVDMAKMKAEYLYQMGKHEGFSLRTYLFGHMGALYKLGSYFPKISNFMLSTKPLQALLKWVGVSPKRKLPDLAQSRFSTTYKTIQKGEKKVLLFSDTFTEFITPSIGQDAAFILEKLGLEVIVPKWSCCGRTLISKGLLKQAKAKAQKLIDILYPYAEIGIPIVGLEPSCILTIRDEFRDFHLDENKVDTIVKMTKTLDEFLQEYTPLLAKLLPSYANEISVHGHCHQKSLVGTKPTLDVLKAIPGAHVHEIPSGCCGMAGSFGYESEHYDFSMKIGSLVLFDYIRTHKESVLVASGTSCRSQIEDGTGKKALHLATLLASLLK